MAQRMRRQQSWADFECVLTLNEVAEKGHMACLDTTTGKLVAGKASATIIPIGYFDGDLKGDGTLTARVALFSPIWVHEFGNDTGTPITAADIGSACYVLDSDTVTGDSTGHSIAGRVWGITPTSVVVEMAQSIGFQGAPGV